MIFNTVAFAPLNYTKLRSSPRRWAVLIYAAPLLSVIGIWVFGYCKIVRFVRHSRSGVVDAVYLSRGAIVLCHDIKPYDDDGSITSFGYSLTTERLEDLWPHSTGVWLDVEGPGYWDGPLPRRWGYLTPSFLGFTLQTEGDTQTDTWIITFPAGWIALISALPLACLVVFRGITLELSRRGARKLVAAKAAEENRGAESGTRPID